MLLFQKKPLKLYYIMNDQKIFIKLGNKDNQGSSTGAEKQIVHCQMSLSHVILNWLVIWKQNSSRFDAK